MLPLLLIGIAAISVAVIASDESENNFSEMADTHDQFLKFEQNISVPLYKRKKLISARKALQKRIIEYFRATPNAPVPKFYIQGSYKMGTMIFDSKGTYDVDLGIYFLKKVEVESATLQKWVFDAVKNHTHIGTQHREKCLRVIYKNEFDIDLPVYYMTAGDLHPYLATKNNWIESDPKELCDWFENKKDKNGQLVRLVKYFKAWAYNTNKKMPSGIAFTVWAATYYEPNDRDDIAFWKTAKAINESFFWNTKCRNPATPGDDFLNKLTADQKTNFKSAFDSLIRDGKLALQQTDHSKALNIWKQQLGTKFIG